MAELNSIKITKNDSSDKLRWGYSNIGNFNPKEDLSFVPGTQNIQAEAKWGKIWGGGWWPKVMVFC